MDNPVKLSI